MIYNQLTRELQKNFSEMARLQERLSSGKKINRPSDDATGMARSIDYKLTINAGEQYKRNIDEANNYLSFTDSIMASVTDSLKRAKELALQGATGTVDAASRLPLSKEVGQIRDHLLSLANSRLGNRYVFSGFKTGTAAFSSTFTYNGDSGGIEVAIDKNAKIAINIPGDDAFSNGVATFFNVLDTLKTDLENNNVSGVQSAITSIDDSISSAVNKRAEIGSKLSRLDDQRKRLDSSNYNMKIALSNTQDADIAETIGELSKTEIALQSLRESSSRILSQSLLDFLR
ncbi:MAG: flagellar hook-associated protein FlgL [Nitrospirae bacterium]|nr:flagellar hook-associated protein FlgL [Nitrospirota bacterium]